MRIVNLNGNIYVDKELRNKILNIYNNTSDTVSKGDRVLFLKDSITPRSSIDLVSEDDIKRCRKHSIATVVVIGPQPNISNDELIHNLTKGFVSVDDYDELTDEILYKFFPNGPKELESIEQLEDFINNYPNIKYVKDEELYNYVNSGLVIDKNNYLQTLEALRSSDSNIVKTYLEIINSCDLDKSKLYLSYIFWEYTLISHLTKDFNKRNIVNFFQQFGINIYSDDITNKDKYVDIFKHDLFLKSCFIAKQTSAINSMIKNNLKTTKINLENICLNVN